MRTFFHAILPLVLWACQPAPQPSALVESTSAQAIVLDTAAAYRTAIADYITAMDTTDAPLPDTVYIGRHMEFPAIDLPGRIGEKVIRVITPEEADTLRDAEHFTYLNMFAFHTPDHVEFYIVRFFQGMRHQPDGRHDRHVHYRIGTHGEQVLESVSQ